jgi:hypothetical protein
MLAAANSKHTNRTIHAHECRACQEMGRPIAMSWTPIIIALCFMVLILAMVIFVYMFDTKNRRPRPYTLPSMILYTFADEFALYELLAA